MASTKMKCELCSREAEEGARLCVACVEMVRRIAAVTPTITPNDLNMEQQESPEKKRDRALAKAEKLTPVILG